MKKMIYLAGLVMALAITFTACEKNHIEESEVSADLKKGKKDCTTIQDGTLMYADGHYLENTPLKTGYDVFGYNYQGLMFKGSYANIYLGRPGAAYPPYEGDDEAYLAANPGAENHWAWPHRNSTVIMKWNDAWISNMDCDGDGSLDRHNGYPSYIGSGAWLTNHISAVDENGQNTNYFVKIIAVNEDDTLVDGYWYAPDGTEIGEEIWGQFAIIQEVSTPGGLTYLAPNSGLGNLN
jgi:hypothetical protein